MVGYVFVGVAVLFVLLGAVVWRKQVLDIVAGYDPGKVKDKEGLAKWIGRNLVIMGVLTLVLAIPSMFLEAFRPVYALTAHVLVILAVSMLTIRGAKKYEV